MSLRRNNYVINDQEYKKDFLKLGFVPLAFPEVSFTSHSLLTFSNSLALPPL
ncbi:36888_t:CDS:1, partial [Racocetra persica]